MKDKFVLGLNLLNNDFDSTHDKEKTAKNVPKSGKFFKMVILYILLFGQLAFTKILLLVKLHFTNILMLTVTLTFY